MKLPDFESAVKRLRLLARRALVKLGAAVRTAAAASALAPDRDGHRTGHARRSDGDGHRAARRSTHGAVPVNLARLLVECALAGGLGRERLLSAHGGSLADTEGNLGVVDELGELVDD